MYAIEKTSIIRDRLINRGITLSESTVNTLRRAELTLQRWSELECGDGNDHSSWSIERDEVTDKPFMCIYPHDGAMRKYPTPDREKGALKRIAEICKQNDLHFYHQTDPRGCALYISNEYISDNNYTNGVAICI